MVVARERPVVGATAVIGALAGLAMEWRSCESALLRWCCVGVEVASFLLAVAGVVVSRETRKSAQSAAAANGDY